MIPLGAKPSPCDDALASCNDQPFGRRDQGDGGREHEGGDRAAAQPEPGRAGRPVGADKQEDDQRHQRRQQLLALQQPLRSLLSLDGPFSPVLPGSRCAAPPPPAA